MNCTCTTAVYMPIMYMSTSYIRVVQCALDTCVQTIVYMCSSYMCELHTFAHGHNYHLHIRRRMGLDLNLCLYIYICNICVHEYICRYVYMTTATHKVENGLRHEFVSAYMYICNICVLEYICRYVYMTTAYICTFAFNTSLQTAPANKNRRNQQLRCSTYLYMCTHVHIYTCIHASVYYIYRHKFMYTTIHHLQHPPPYSTCWQHQTQPYISICTHIYQLPVIAQQSLYVYIHAYTFVHMHTCAHV